MTPRFDWAVSIGATVFVLAVLVLCAFVMYAASQALGVW